MKNSTSHLGGHLYRTWTDEKTLKYLIEKYEVKSMVDVGCGPGGQVDLAESFGVKSIGIDGDINLKIF